MSRRGMSRRAGPGAPLGARPLVAAYFGTRGCRGPARLYSNRQLPAFVPSPRLKCGLAASVRAHLSGRWRSTATIAAREPRPRTWATTTSPLAMGGVSSYRGWRGRALACRSRRRVEILLANCSKEARNERTVGTHGNGLAAPQRIGEVVRGSAGVLLKAFLGQPLRRPQSNTADVRERLQRLHAPRG